MGTALSRGARLKCPKCGEGKLFVGLFRMHEKCANCKFKYERAPGYFLGAAYINYGITALILTVLYVSLHFYAGYDNRVLTPVLVFFFIAFPLLFFRHARSFWLAIDCVIDVVGFNEDKK